MAERFVSPGVFTKENDLSFLPQGIAQIGAGFIGPTSRGPAFRPVIVESATDFQKIFGDMNPDFYTPYAVRSYFNSQATKATVVRILGLTGYDPTAAKGLLLEVSGSGGIYSVGYIHPSQTGVSLLSGSVSGSPTNFTLEIMNSSTTSSFTSLSIDPDGLLANGASAYFSNVLGGNPSTTNVGYTYTAFPNAANYVSGALAGSGSMRLTVSTTELYLTGSVYGTYHNAKTPMVRSQLYGSTRYDLFQFYTLSDGNAANADVRVAISAIQPSTLSTNPYGTFTVTILDSEGNPTDEAWSNLNLDPTSANYIGRRIGTARPVIDANGDVYLEGEYTNNSKYVYVDISDAITSIPTDALPYAHAPLATPINKTNVPGVTYVTTVYDANDSIQDIYYGFDFTDSTNLAYLAPTPSGSINASGDTLISGVGDTGFDLLTSVDAADDTLIASSTGWRYSRYVLPMQGGFDGQNPAQLRYTGASIVPSNTMGFDLTNANSAGSVAYAQAITAISNPDSWDINLLIMPGVIYSQHPYVATLGMNMCTTRGDCFYIMDPEVLGATTANAVSSVSTLDTNYSGVYHPWVKILDTDNNKNVWVPPSVVMGGVYAYNDIHAAEWYAPAGLNRGGITEALQVRTRLSQDNRDDLYQGRVNPIAQFPGQGIVVWGQKTLQQRASALDRINVRRLLITVKKYIASTSRYLVFEPNVDATRQRFLSTVNPYLASIQERYGLYAFKVIMDDTNNTADLIDRNILVGDLYLQPTKTAEFIQLTFNVLPTGATFPE